ncbi:MAG: hypothetical protein K6B75_08155 [Lachnospiraceae bacterium]|nr:hypothetical protein [Lachnospiraceae bacterium]
MSINLNELSDKDLKNVAGGSGFKCGSDHNTTDSYEYAGRSTDGKTYILACSECGKLRAADATTWAWLPADANKAVIRRMFPGYNDFNY